MQGHSSALRRGISSVLAAALVATSLGTALPAVVAAGSPEACVVAADRSSIDGNGCNFSSQALLGGQRLEVGIGGKSVLGFTANPEFAGEQFGGVAHDQAHAAEIQFTPAIFGEEGHAGFLNQGKQTVIAEVSATRITERGASRADDLTAETAMEDRKRVGYF